MALPVCIVKANVAFLTETKDRGKAHVAPLRIDREGPDVWQQCQPRQKQNAPSVLAEPDRDRTDV